MWVPGTDRLAGTPWATQLLRLQHEQICRHLDQLRTHGLSRIELHRRAALEMDSRLHIW